MNEKGFNNGMRAIHPGEVLREDFMRPLNLSSNALAKALGVPSNRISQTQKNREVLVETLPLGLQSTLIQRANSG